MLTPTTISRDVNTNGYVLDHDVAGGTYSAAPTLATQGFVIRGAGGNAYDALEATYSYDVTADATTLAVVRPWFYVPDHAPGGTPVWLSAKEMENIGIAAGSGDVFGPVRRINSVPAGATKMYLQVVSIAGTAPAHLYMVVFGLVGMVATVEMPDIQVDIEPGPISIGSVKIEDETVAAQKAWVVPANQATAATDHVILVQPRDATGHVLSGGGGVGGGAGIYSAKQLDFTVTYTAATQLTIAGTPAGLTVGNFVQVGYWDATGNLLTYTPSANAFAWNDATGVLTVTGATFTNAGGEDYDVLLWYTPKAFNPGINANSVQETAPDRNHVANYELANVTNGVDATYQYAFDPKTYRKTVVALTLTKGAHGVVGSTLVATIWATWKPGGVAGDCRDITQEFFGVTNINDASTDLSFRDPDGLLSTATYVFVQLVENTGGNNDSNWTIRVGSVA